MKIISFKQCSRGIRRVATATAVILPLSVGLAASAQAELCSPLRVSGMQIVDPLLIREGGSVRGVDFRVRYSVKNTNPTRTYYGNNRTNLSLLVRATAPGDDQDYIPKKFRRHIGGGNVQTFISDRVQVMRDPGNLAELKAEIKGYLYNEQCERGKHLSQSRHVFDLIGVLQNRPVRRISARIWGYSEERSPRPGTGAPRPRS